MDEPKRSEREIRKLVKRLEAKCPEDKYQMNEMFGRVITVQIQKLNGQFATGTCSFCWDNIRNLLKNPVSCWMYTDKGPVYNDDSMYMRVRVFFPIENPKVVNDDYYSTYEIVRDNYDIIKTLLDEFNQFD